MANEARVQSGLYIRKTSGALILLEYQSRPSAFLADVSGTKGPSPGAIRVPIAGVDISFPELTTPGLCWLHNLDATNYVEVGIYVPATLTFFPLLELMPGECYTVRLSRNLLEQYAGSGTGTTGSINKLRLKANTAPCNVRVDAFEK